MNKHQKPENCMCMGNCAICRQNASSTDDKKTASRRFGDYPFDMDEAVSEFIDRHSKK